MSRFIALMRKKTLLNNKRAWNIVLDRKPYDIICGGETTKITIDDNCHTLSVQSNDRKTEEFDEIFIPKGNKNFIFQVSLGTTMVGNTSISCIKLKEMWSTAKGVE